MSQYINQLIKKTRETLKYLNHLFFFSLFNIVLQQYAYAAKTYIWEKKDG